MHVLAFKSQTALPFLPTEIWVRSMSRDTLRPVEFESSDGCRWVNMKK